MPQRELKFARLSSPKIDDFAGVRKGRFVIVQISPTPCRSTVSVRGTMYIVDISPVFVRGECQNTRDITQDGVCPARGKGTVAAIIEKNLFALPQQLLTNNI